MTLTLDGLADASIADIAELIREDWGAKVNYAAEPYLEAMEAIQSIEDRYYQDDAASVVSYFLANAGTYRGETARAVKAELKRRTAAYYGAR